MAVPLKVATVVETPVTAQKSGQLFTWIKGYSVFSTLSWLYDYPFYTFVIWKFGPIWGGVFLSVLSLFIDIATLRFYDWSKEDWLALEYVKSIREYEGSSKLKRAFRWVLRTPTPIQVFVLSLRLHPPVVTLLLRSGAYQFGKMSRRDWFVFWGSSLVGNMYWAGVIFTGIEAAKFFGS